MGLWMHLQVLECFDQGDKVTAVKHCRQLGGNTLHSIHDSTDKIREGCQDWMLFVYLYL